MKQKINENLLKNIKEMFDADQDLRNLWDNKDLTKPLAQWSGKNSAKNKLNFGLINYLVYFVDAAHNPRLHRIIEQYGYPTTKLLGKKGMLYFFVLIDHQDYDIDLQKACLAKCDFEKKHIANLTDRILLHEGKKQIYGTMFQRDSKGQKIISQPIADKKNVDKKRKEMGLGPLQIALDSMNKKFYKK
ncbi:hypothetical protein GW933_00175 [Candidatus Falkowbacteria bacterium]|uniref:Uncharacterized protein n=1 Tax=Candidatus Buchananbacteria bacterium CG10_big_fil_rev_8_21_14_0_10_33_19 TaxID=1974525 RepID=A0A2H0W2W3_9BACT|nr:hypothetical protein [Candidatus Falkowbacteria bacterium]PIS05674.1 MAG: hypothetical protein COT80_02800 [Candidatus Buchananbacteria bacterium CG10_big_fil_rev_8_21_14_0_10_33_19]